jgi:hypothetical protein
MFLSKRKEINSMKINIMKNLTFVLFAFLCLSFCFFSCGSDEEMNEPDGIDFTIVPGQGIGTLRIGDLGSKVKTELGEGFIRIVNVGTSGNATYNYFNDPKGIDIIFGQYDSGDLDADMLPIQSFDLFDDFNGMTKEGIKLGSTMAEVIAAYGEPDEMDMWSTVYKIGMIISYDDMDMIRSIRILEI